MKNVRLNKLFTQLNQRSLKKKKSEKKIQSYDHRIINVWKYKDNFNIVKAPKDKEPPS